MSLDSDGQGLPEGLQRRPYDLGVLLVHGIGLQRRGDTLEANGGALLESIRDYINGWLGADVSARVSVERTSVGESSGPEYFVANIDIEPPPRPGASRPAIERRRWLIAESHWADVFPTPTYKEIANWTGNVLPVVAALHCDRYLRRAVAQLDDPESETSRTGRVVRLMTGAGLALVAAVLVPLLMILLLALLAFGALPLPFVKRPAQLAQRLLAGSVGDSFVLLERSVAAARIIDRVRRDMCWLGECCERVAMVAHSQGGAVAHEVVRCNPRMPCDLLITYGSGLRKLGMLKRYLQSDEQQRSDATTVRAAAPRLPIRKWFDWFRGGLLLLCAPWLVLLLALVLRSAIDIELPGLPAWLVLFAVALVAGVLCIWRWARQHGTRADPNEQLQVEKALFHGQYELVNANTRWLDLHSSHDPVSNGPLLDVYQPEGLNTHEVRVFGSMFSDHTGYWRSRDDFLLGLTRELFLLDEGSPREDSSGDLTANTRAWVVRRRRRYRVAWLALARGCGALVAVTAAIGFITAAPPLYRRLADIVAEPLGAIPWLGERLAGTWGDSLLAVLTGVALGLASHALLKRVWGVWDARESQCAVGARVAVSPGPLPRPLVAYLVAAVAVVAAVSAMWWPLVAVPTGIALTLLLMAIGRWQRPRPADPDRLAGATRRRTLFLRGSRLIASDDDAEQARGASLLKQSLDLGFTSAGFFLGDYLERVQHDYVAAAGVFETAGAQGDRYCELRHAQLLLDTLERPGEGEAVLAGLAEGEGDELARVLLADALAARGDRDGALVALRKSLSAPAGTDLTSLERRRSNHCAWRIATMSDDDSEVVGALRTAFDSGQVRAAARLADHSLRRGDRTAAAAILRDGMALGSAESASRLGDLLYDEGDPAGAVQAWERAMVLASRRRRWPPREDAARRVDRETSRVEYRHGAAAAAALATHLRRSAPRRASTHAAIACLRFARRAEPLAHSGIHQLLLELAAPEDADDRLEEHLQLALAFGSVDAGLRLAERWWGDDLQRALDYARRSVALESERLSGLSEAPAHRMLSRMLEDDEDQIPTVVALLRTAAKVGDVAAMDRLVYWMDVCALDHGEALPDLDAFIDEVAGAWQLPHGRFRVARAVLTQPETPERLRNGAALAARTRCGTAAERVVQRHLAALYAER